MKYEELSKTKIVETPDGRHLRVISYEHLLPELSNDIKSDAEVTVESPDGATLVYQVCELKPGDENKLAKQAMACFFPKP